MDLSLILAIINIAVVPVASAAAYLLWNKIVTLERSHLVTEDKIWAELKLLERDVSAIKGNYLTRFDEIKDLLHGYHLQSIEKISILETLLKQHIRIGE